MTIANHAIRMPDRKLAREVTDIVRGSESELLSNHSMFGSPTGEV